MFNIVVVTMGLSIIGGRTIDEVISGNISTLNGLK